MDRSAPNIEVDVERIQVEVTDVAAPPNDATFAEMVGEELPRLQRIARLLVGAGDVADDLVAEALARTLPKWRAGDLVDPFAYTRRVLVNLANRRWRRQALSRRRDHLALDWLQPIDDHETDTAERDRTLRAIGRLPMRRRAVVVLRFYDDLGEARIAEVLGIKVGTVKSTLSRALEQLRADLGTLEGA